MGVDASLRRFSLTDEEHPFIGLRNFRRVLTDAQFLGVVLPNTFFFMLASVAGGVVLGLAIAILLNRPFPGRTAIRTLFVFPLMVAPVVASIMIAWIFNDQFGVANAIITSLGFPPVAWLVKPWLSLCIVVLTDVWLQTPFYVIIILAALETLPREPFEAARVDGANAWQTFRNVTLPLLRPVLLVAIVIRSIDAFRQGRARPADGGLQHLRVQGSLRLPEPRPRGRGLAGGRGHHHGRGDRPLLDPPPGHRGVAVTARPGGGGALAKGWRSAFVGLVLAGVLGLFLFPVFWLTLTALRPESEVFYVHRGTQLTLANFLKAWHSPKIQESFLNSAVLATLATVFSLQVTVMSGYMLSRFKGASSKIWFSAIYLFRTVPYITWVMPLYLLTQSLGLFDTYLGLLLPHVAVHV
jgi:ABC-type sugar transport system permease subunit